MKNFFMLSALAVSLSAGAVLPEATVVTVEQRTTPSRLVTITYELANAPAVVTVDIETNAANGAWVSIGPAALLGEGVRTGNGPLDGAVAGDVNRVVSGAGPHVITWKARQTWPGQMLRDKKLRAVVTAWPTEMPPDYLVVDAREDVQDRLRYYPSLDWLPGGLLSNRAYRTTHFVMRRIPAKYVPWEMGSHSFSISVEPYPAYYANMPTPFAVTLTNDYYIGVFEVTQSQWTNVCPFVAKKCYPSFQAEGDLRPMESVSFRCIRESAEGGAVPEARYPAAPGESSYLGLLRKRTGVDFDLPSEAQWWFAARAGWTDFNWGCSEEYRLGTMPGRNQKTGGYIGGTTKPDATVGPENATAIVGSYRPNDFGLYDMFGNVGEFCLDWWEAQIWQHRGATNANGDLDLDGNEQTKRVYCGGTWSSGPGQCRYRNNSADDNYNNAIGFRLMCRLGLE